MIFGSLLVLIRSRYCCVTIIGAIELIVRIDFIVSRLKDPKLPSSILIPELLINKSSVSVWALINLCESVKDLGSVTSSGVIEIKSGFCVLRSCRSIASEGWRQVAKTRSPREVNWRTNSKPMPLFAPVIKTFFM